MIATPWNIVLTVVFVSTAMICLGEFITRRRRAGTGAEFADSDLLNFIDINHGAMSIAMIVMLWWSVWDAVAWVQIAIFTLLALTLAPSYHAASRTKAIDLSGHIALDAAMIWMLSAMPLLMAKIDAGDAAGDAHADHHDGGGATLASTPAWADVVNLVFIGICVIAAVWWISRIFTARHRRIHTLCYIAVAAGMGWMLVLMSA